MDFDSAAITWDNERRIKRAAIIAKQIVDAIEPIGCWRAMDFGCGTGLVSFQLQKLFREMTLVDTSKGMIEALRHKIQENGIKNMVAVHADVNEERQTLGKFHVIYTSMALHHVVEMEKTLKSFYSLLEMGGCLCIVDLTEDDGSFHIAEKNFNGYNGFRQAELKEWLKRAGFVDIQSRVFYNGEKMIEGENVRYSLFLMIGRKAVVDR